MFELFSKRQKELHGQTPEVYRYDEIPYPLKVQAIQIWREIAMEFPAVTIGRIDIFSGVQQVLTKEYGCFRLINGSETPEEDVCKFFLNEQDVKKCLDVIQVSFAVFAQFAEQNSYTNPYWLEVRDCFGSVGASLH